MFDENMCYQTKMLLIFVILFSRHRAVLPTCPEKWPRKSKIRLVENTERPSDVDFTAFYAVTDGNSDITAFWGFFDGVPDNFCRREV